MKHQLHMAVLVLLLTGCAASRGPDGTVQVNADDPYEGLNRKLYGFNKRLDRMVLKPVTKGYQTITPTFMQRGISNFFNNLRLIPSILNGVLQLNGPETTMNAGRLIMNSTIGVLGFLDLATPSGLNAHYEDFGQTLAKWGVKKSSYLMLPFYGPSTIRDGVGIFIDASFLSIWPYVESDKLYWTMTALNVIDTRAKQLKNEGALQAASLDEYAFIRDAYLQHRAHKINETLGKDDVGDLNETDDLLDPLYDLNDQQPVKATA